MRRKEKLREDPEFFEFVFNSAEEIHMAFHDGEYPYCLPFNFAYAHSAIYIHCAREGHKLQCLKANPHVGFSLACQIEIDRRRNNTWFKSLCGKGMATVVTDDQEKRRALDLLARRYNSNCKIPATREMIDRVAIIRVDIVALTGKDSRPTS